MKTNLKLICSKCFSSAAAAPPKSVPTDFAAAKPFADIPGPRGLFGFGNLYKYLPLVGSYSWLQLHKAGQDKYQRYGAIVRETIAPGQDVVWLYDPSDIALLLNERDYPQRRSHLALEKFRKDRPHIYRSAGLLPTNGADWWRLRSELQKEISSPKSVRTFLADVDAVTLEFVQHLPSNESFDILPKLSRLNLELTCLLTFDERLNAFSPEEQADDSRSSRLVRAACTTNSQILPTDQGLQLWRLFETPAYRKLRKAQEYMQSVVVDLVAQKISFFKEVQHQQHQHQQEEQHTTHMNRFQNLGRSSLIEEYLKNPKLDLSDVVGMASDLVLAGIDTTSYTTAFALFHIAKHQQVQQQMYEESLRVLSDEAAPVTGECLRTQIPYTRAVLKEVFRLNPVSIGVGRILNKDLVFSGYQVPKGTVVVTQNMVACRQTKYFTDPLKFNPDRWLQRNNSCNPYLVLPFGHGMRACIARRLAEQNIMVLLLKLIRTYNISWNGFSDDLDVKTLLINKPSEPVNLILSRRETT